MTVLYVLVKMKDGIVVQVLYKHRYLEMGM